MTNYLLIISSIPQIFNCVHNNLLIFFTVCYIIVLIGNKFRIESIKSMISKDQYMEKTYRLFDDDSYIKEFDALVLDYFEEGGKYGVILDKTAFFPEGGGQDADLGTIDGAEVFDVQEKDGIIVHYLSTSVEKGSTVHGVIDFEERFRRMQNHTGEHILSGIVHRLYGFENVGFHLSKEYVRVDLDGVLTAEDVRKVEILCNKAIVENHSVKAYYPDPETLDTIEYRSKKDICRKVRLAVIEGVDICACCAPHVARTGEIGLLKICDYIKYKGGTRLEIVCGRDALETFFEEHDILSKIAVSASAKREEVPAVFDRLNGEIRSLKGELSSVNRAYSEKLLSEIKYTGGNLCFFFGKGFDVNTMRDFVNGGKEKCKGVFAAFAGDDKNGYRYIAASNNVNMRENAPRINFAIDGKGGGSPQMIQGTANAEKGIIIEFFDKM